MPNLAALRQNSARLSFEYAGATFTVFYRPLDVDDDAHQALRGMSIGGDMEPFYQQLERLVIWWDATEDDAMVPTTVAGFKRSGLAVCGHLMRAILADVGNPTWAPSPDQASPTPSSNGSSPTASSAPTASPTTTTWSPPPSGPGSTPPTSSAAPISAPGLVGTRGLAASDVP